MRTFPNKIIIPGLLTHILILLGVIYTKIEENKKNEEIQNTRVLFDDLIINIKDLKIKCNELTAKEAIFIFSESKKVKFSNRKYLFEFETKFNELKYLIQNSEIDKKIFLELEKSVDQKLHLASELFYQTESLKEKTTDIILQSNEVGETISKKTDLIINKLFELRNNKTIAILNKKKTIQLLFNVFFLVGLLLLFVVFLILRFYVNNNKKVFDNLIQSTNLLQGLIDYSPTPISLKGLDGKYSFSNRKFNELIEKNVKTVIGNSDSDLFHADKADQMREKDLEVLKIKSPVKYEAKLALKGESVSFINTKFPILNTEGNIIAIGTISTDISERSKSDLELYLKEQTMRNYFENCPGALIVIDDSSKIVAVNQKTIKNFGWDKNEMIGQYMPGLMMNQESWEKHQQGMKKFSETGLGPVLNGTLELIAYDKTKKELKIELTVKDFKIGEVQFFIGLIQDVTEKKKKSNELEENLVFLNSIIENLPNMIFIKDAKTLKFLRINKAGEKLLGINRNEIIGKNDYDFFPKKEADFFTRNDKEVLTKTFKIDIPEEEISTRLGNRWLHTQKIALFNHDQTPHYLLGISEDITEKKILGKERDNALNQIKESELRLELVLSNIGEGVVLTDEHQHVLLFNQMASEIFNTDNQQTLSRWTSEFQFFHPETKAIYPAQMLPLERALRGQSTDDVEIILQEIKTEHIKLIKVNGRPIQNNEGKIVAAVATIKDITHLKEIEKKLEESEMKYRQTIGFKQEKKD